MSKAAGMQNVRQRILQIIQERGRATVAELAEALGMAPVSVRHHLDILQGDGLIRVDGVRRRSGAGRPQHVYALTPEATHVFPKNYDGVLHHLLNELKAAWPPEAFEDLLVRLARRMAQEMSPFSDEELPPEVALDAVVAALNEQGYMARWERVDEGYAVFLANCPYAGLLDDHDEFCRLDAYLLREMWPPSADVRVRETIREGAYRCVLIIPVRSKVPV